MTQYLVLKFENAGLVYGRGKHFVKSDYGNKGHNEKSEGHDIVTPIPYTLLSNVLHKLCGEIPVPSKRPTFLKRLEIFDNIAKNSYIKYDIKPLAKKSGYGYDNAEVFRTAKYAFDSHQNANTKFVLHDGSTIIYKGYYSWAYLEKTCENKANFDLVCDFLSDAIGEDCRKYTFEQMITKLSNYWNSDAFKAKAETFFKECKFLSKPWVNLFTNNPKCSSNTKYSSKTPLLYTSGVSNIIYLRGEIVCPIDNDEVIQAIKENSGTATILEHGLIYVKGLKKCTHLMNFEDDYEKIFEENEVQATENQDVIV